MGVMFSSAYRQTLCLGCVRGSYEAGTQARARSKRKLKGSGNHKGNNLYYSAIGTLIRAITKLTFKSVSKENMKPPSGGILLKDRISELPAEIIVDILSKLKTKESGSTSVLSRRWRHMWTETNNIDFDGSEVLDDVHRKIKCVEVERPIYVSCINQVLMRHEARTIDQFVVVFSLDNSSSSDIDGWVNSAVRKRVQRLKLDLRCRGFYQRANYYSFPNSLEISSCSSLSSLHLAMVDITSEILELLLYNCLNLERVFVRQCNSLLSLNVDGPSLKLKWLELVCCPNIKWLNVSAPNLVSFKYDGPVIPMPLKDVPKMLELSITGVYSDYYFNSHLRELSSYLSQLEKLTLGACVYYQHTNDVSFPVLPKLKNLTLMVGFSHFDSIVDYVSLINACPSLYYFSFQNWVRFKCPIGEAFKTGKASHNTIKVVEFNGFRGNAFEVEMAEYLIENAVLLEKITFDTTSPPSKGMWHQFLEPESRISARECAGELGKRLRRGVELVIVS